MRRRRGDVDGQPGQLVCLRHISTSSVAKAQRDGYLLLIELGA
jgi:hypothetical protein